MSIELHCPRCSKLIRAPDEAGGRHGRCPYCKENVYVPLPAEEGDEIGLAPIDEAEEERIQRLRRESAEYIATVGHEAEPPPESDGSGRSGGASVRPPPVPGEAVDLGAEVKAFLAAMRDSKLEEADQAVARLEKAGPRARDYVEGLMLDEMPPQVENVPPALIKGFLKTLVSRLS